MRDRLNPPPWTDASEHDPGIALVELLAYVGDVLSWYQDQVANEARLRTRRRAVAALGALAVVACWWSGRRRRPRPAISLLRARERHVILIADSAYRGQGQIDQVAGLHTIGALRQEE
jgi:hypothetical protein